MKKITTILLALSLLLGAVPCLAEDVPAAIALPENLSLVMEVPQGYAAKTEKIDTALYALISAQDAALPSFIFSLAYADVTDGPTPGEMTQEDIDLAMQLVAADFFNPTFSIMTAGGGTKFLVINENDAESDFAMMIANYEGYFIQMFITPGEGLEVAEADVTTALDILTSMSLKTE